MLLNLLHRPFNFLFNFLFFYAPVYQVLGGAAWKLVLSVSYFKTKIYNFWLSMQKYSLNIRSIPSTASAKFLLIAAESLACVKKEGKTLAGTAVCGFRLQQQLCGALFRIYYQLVFPHFSQL